MSRRGISHRAAARLNIAEGVYHVTQRGVEQRDIVAGDEDRREWLWLLGHNLNPQAPS